MTATLFDPPTGSGQLAAGALREQWQRVPEAERVAFLDKVRRQFLTRSKREPEPAATTRRRRKKVTVRNGQFVA